MLTSFVVRLSGEALAVSRLAGEVEHVGSGARGQFRDADDLVAWCSAAVAAVPSPRCSSADLHVLTSTSADPGARP